jgi:hypothetical protein
MHTVIVIGIGLVLLGVCLAIGRFMDKSLASAALVFIPIWLVGAAINLWMGVARAGYSVGEELPFFLVVFAVPAVIAAFIWWNFS